MIDPALCRQTNVNRIENQQGIIPSFLLNKKESRSNINTHLKRITVKPLKLLNAELKIDSNCKIINIKYQLS